MIKAYSFSKIEKWLKCGELFRWLYLDKTVPKIATDNVATVAGSIVHEVLEVFHPTPTTMQVLDLLDGMWIAKLPDYSLVTQLDEIRFDMARLYERASAAYRGPDAIRDENGKAYKAPLRSTAWRIAMERLDLPRRQDKIDKQGALLGKPFNTVSLSNVYSETYRILGNYANPIAQAGLTICATELAFSKINYKAETVEFPVEFPGTGIYYTGKIDAIAIDVRGRLVLLDHKTSKPPAPSPAEVANWDQLLLYCFAHEQVWGRLPDFMGINHIVTGKFVLVPVDPLLVQGAVRRAIQAVMAIEAGMFIQQSPGGYSSHCHNKFGTGPCDYLKHCHPAYFAQISLM